MAETPVSARKSTPLKRLLLNLNNPDEEPDEAVLLADLPDTYIGWACQCIEDARGWCF
jgi:hypothetical protein